MPHAQFMPTVVFPKTYKGIDDYHHWDKSSDTNAYFCDEFSPDGRQCARRNPDGVRAKNLCYRCVAGYLYDFKRAVEQDDDENRLKI